MFWAGSLGKSERGYRARALLMVFEDRLEAWRRRLLATSLSVFTVVGSSVTKKEPSFSFQPLIISMLRAKRPVDSSLCGLSGMNGVGATGMKTSRPPFASRENSYVIAVERRVSKGRLRRQASSFALVEAVQFTSVVSLAVCFADSPSAMPGSARELPDSMMARLKRVVFFAPYAVMCRPTAVAPSLSPNIVTLSGSPPKAAMFLCTHSSARRWSSRPAFRELVALRAGEAANPKMPSR